MKQRQTPTDTLHVRRWRAYYAVYNGDTRTKIFTTKDDALAWIDAQAIKAQQAGTIATERPPDKWTVPKPAWTHVSDDEWAYHCYVHRNGDPYCGRGP